jgi:uncharacterized protein YkwD
VLVALGLVGAVLALAVALGWVGGGSSDGAPTGPASSGRASSGGASGGTPSTPDALAGWSADEAPDAYARRLLGATNEARADEGVAALAWSDCAARVAADRASALVGAAELEHAPLDDAMVACDVDLAAENLSRGAAGPREVVDAWLGSAGHRANLLDPTLAEVGIGCAREPGGELTCAQVFLG